MKRLCGLKIGILMLMYTYICDTFHLQGQPSVRRSVCGAAPPCCPGHICRAYQRFDASRPVAACAISLQSRPLYAPGSPAQRRICGSTSRDLFSQRLRSRDQGIGRELIGQRSFPGMSRQQRFPGQVGDLQQLGRTSPRRRFTDRRLPISGARAQFTSFTDRSRFDPLSFASRQASGSFPVTRSGPFRGQLNPLASEPDERSQFGFERNQFPGSRRSFSSDRTSFTRGQDQFSGRLRSFGRTGFGQDRPLSQPRPSGRGQGLTESQAIISQLSQFPTEQLTQGSSLLDQSFGFQDSPSQDSQSLTASGQAVLPSRGSAFTSRSRTVEGALGFQDLLPQADRSSAFLSQGDLSQNPLPNGISEPLVPQGGASQPGGASQSLLPQGGVSQTFLPPGVDSLSFLPPDGASQRFFPTGGASQTFLPPDGVPQPMLVETPGVSKTPIQVSVSGTSKNLHIDISNKQSSGDIPVSHNEHSVLNTEHSIQNNNVQIANIRSVPKSKSKPRINETQPNKENLSNNGKV